MQHWSNGDEFACPRQPLLQFVRIVPVAGLRLVLDMPSSHSKNRSSLIAADEYPRTRVDC